MTAIVEQLRVTLLMDNTAAIDGVASEHGLSMYIEAGDRKVLFDTGQSAAFLRNARQRGCDVAQVDAVAISHGHYDHSGGLAEALVTNESATIFVHPDALRPKYSRGNNGRLRSIGIPDASLKALQAARDRVVWVRGATEIVAGVWCTGEIPRTVSPGIDNSRFFLDEEGLRPDPLTDDQALYVQTVRGVVLLAACTHAGVRNTFDYITRLSGRDEFLAVIGGLHLNGASQDAWDAAAEALIQRKVKWIAPCHCTGSDAWSFLRHRLGEKVLAVGAGWRFTLQDAI